MTITPAAPTRGTITVPVRLDPETRSSSGELRLSGLAAPYGQRSLDMGFFEVIDRGAFKRSLESGRDVLLLWQHDMKQPLARQSAGNLEVTETADGIRFRATLPNTTLARDAVELVRSGVITEMSFAFEEQVGEWQHRNGERVRVVREAKLFELSLVSEAAYGKATSVGNRDLQRAIEQRVQRMRRTPGVENPYRPEGPHSYFRDLLVATAPQSDPGWLRSFQQGGVADAKQRLRAWQASAEFRDLTTTATDGGGFVPTAPVHIADTFARAVRAKGVLPSVFPVKPLPEHGMEIGAPRITTGIGTEVQATQNTAPTEADLVEAKVTSPVSTILGYEDVSVQLLERGEGVDLALAGELGAAYAADLDVLLLTGSGTAPNLRGLDNVSGISTVAYTDASPTQAEAWAKLVELAATVATALGDEPTHVLLAARRHAWLFGSAWASAPPTLPYGMRAVPCNSITTVYGAGTNEDKAYVVAAPELPVYLQPPTFSVATQTTSLNEAATARVTVHGYASALFGLRPEAIGILSGTGLAAPATY